MSFQSAEMYNDKRGLFVCHVVVLVFFFNRCLIFGFSLYNWSADQNVHLKMIGPQGQTFSRDKNFSDSVSCLDT